MSQAYRMLIGCLLLTLTILSIEGRPATADGHHTYQRIDSECANWPGCEKTYCFAGGAEDCTAQYCNKANCG